MPILEDVSTRGRSYQAHASDISIRLDASKDIHIPMAKTACSKHHSMWMESGACDRACFRGDERWGIGVESVDGGAVDVEDG